MGITFFMTDYGVLYNCNLAIHTLRDLSRCDQKRLNSRLNQRIAFSETAKSENFGQAQDAEMRRRFVYVVYTKNNTQIR